MTANCEHFSFQQQQNQQQLNEYQEEKVKGWNSSSSLNNNNFLMIRKVILMRNWFGKENEKELLLIAMGKAINLIDKKRKNWSSNLIEDLSIGKGWITMISVKFSGFIIVALVFCCLSSCYYCCESMLCS